MPLFGRKGNKYVGAVQCGGGLDAFLEFELSRSPVEKIEMYALPPMKHGLSEGVESEKILAAAVEGAKQAAEDHGECYYVKCIGYVPNDSLHYRLHKRVVWETIRHIARGGEFRTIESVDD